MGTIKLIFLLLAFMLPQPPSEEDPFENMGWEVLLKDVKMRYRYDTQHNAFLPVPRFGRNLQAMEGTEITLKGFFLPADVTGNVFVVSYMPMAMCFFCAGAGIESVAEIHNIPQHLARFRRLKTDDFIEVKGTLRLNTDDMDHLVYILENAELIRVFPK
jgi:uncharacterized membrane protein YcgQ (UPF0703/DUF1980 family)